MALVLKDRVQETTTTTGTGAVTLDGAETGFQGFDAVGSGNETYYTITDGTDWEVGVGSYVDVPSAPALTLDFDQTTTLPAGITFTRATNGTFFNSSGVLSTAASGAARFDHRLERGVWVNKGLLIEEQRTNQLQRSEEFNDAYWTKTNVTVTANQTTAPDGTTTADAIFETTTNAGHSFYAGNYSATNTTLSASVYIKANGRTLVRFQISNFLNSGVEGRFNLSTGTTEGTGGTFGSDYTNTSASITDVGNGWYRITISATKGSVNSNNYFLIEFRNDANQGTYVGDVTKGYFFWGAQLEVGAFPTSYIKTTTASVTRNADVASMTSTDFSSWYNATEGTTFWQGDTVRVTAITGLGLRGYEISDNTINERFGFTVGFEGNTRSFFGIDGGASQWNILSPDPAVALVANQTYKAASAYKLNDFAHSLDGNSPGTDTSGTLPTVNKINIGADFNASSNFLNGHIAKFYYWNTRLSNGTLRFLSARGPDVLVGRSLYRDSVLSSTNSNAKVDLAAGTKTVFSPLPAQATLGSAATADNSSIGTDQYAWTNFKKLLDQSVIGGVAYGNNGTNGIVSTYSLVYTASGAFLGGVLAPNGDVHFVPFNANRGQKISASGVVSTYALVYTLTITSPFAYIGGVLAPNGEIHFVPFAANRGQKISASGVVSTYSLVYTLSSGGYSGGVLAPNGDIHFVPRNADRGQKVSASGVVSTYSLVYTGSDLYNGGVLDPNGDIHFVPRSADRGQKISALGTVSTYSLVYTTTVAFAGGVLSTNGDIHFVPQNANRGQKISASGVVSTYSLIYTTTAAYVGGVLAPNGDIHFVPTSAPVGQKISAAGTVSTYSLVYTGSSLYLGGVLRPDGSIVFTPNSAAVGQIISTNPGIPLGQEACLSSYLNKY
jgi:hypothetical protein